jgi:DNA polymerase-4
MDDLLSLDCDRAGHLWGSVWGERFFHWIRGEDFEMSEHEHLKSLSHQHVLAPDMRTKEGAWAVAHKLLHKAAMRLRSGGLWAGNIGLAVGFAVPRSENAPVSRFGVPSRGWHGEIKLSECQDNQTLIAALRKLWQSQPDGAEYAHPFFVGVQLGGLVPNRLHTLSLFDSLDSERSRARLLAAMDGLNQKYGLSTLAPATMLSAYRAAPTRIAFHSIPELF